MSPGGSGIVIKKDDPTSPALAALLALHVAFGRAHTPPENAHVLDPAALATDAITFWTAWDHAALAGMAALRELAPDHGELKSMRTAPGHLRKGVARALLTHVITVARTRGYTRLSLETGTATPFAPANALYERVGFGDCDAFGGYPASPHNRFMTMPL